ncbi:MAG: Gfo/Idh/MocA family oxidoreductase [Gemmataceae bacterium]
MRFALLGNHPDGIALAAALAATGRHAFVAYSGPLAGIAAARALQPDVQAVGDLEEILADPAVELVIVAGGPSTRPAQLRRTLQSERHVLCVHPADPSADVAYESAMIRDDTRCVLLPLLPDMLHPGVLRLAELTQQPDSPLGVPRLIELEIHSPAIILLDAELGNPKPGFPGWSVLHQVGGSIAEVSAFAAAEEVDAEAPILLAGRFENGCLWQARLLPNQYESRWRLMVQGNQSRAELVFADGWPKAATLTWRHDGKFIEEMWSEWQPWPRMVELIEAALQRRKPDVTFAGQRLPTWHEEIRCLELDDAARRGIERRRAYALEYPDATEATHFKGTMTLVGCGLIWAMLLLLLIAAWMPWVGWFIVPVLAVFILLQLLRWIIPRQEGETRE